MTERYLTCIGDGRSAATWSGIVYHLAQAGKRTGFITDGWSVFPERVRGRRLLWNVLELLRSGQRGGYQYTLEFASRMLAQVPESERRGEVISTFPVFPPADWVPGRVNFYIDATFTQLFGEYGKGELVSQRVQQDALARERDQYAAAAHICCMSRWAASAVVESYGVSPEKVHVVGGGANLPDNLAPNAGRVPDPPGSELVRLGFVGKDWKRKGLPALLGVGKALEQMGWRVEVAAAGFDPDKGPRHELLRAVGFIDKSREPFRMASFMSACHFGCLFSEVEAYGLSNVEFLRLGVPVLTRDAGGMADTVPSGCGYVFAPGVSPQVMAETVDGVLRDFGRYEQMRQTVMADSRRFTWDAVVERMQAVWSGSTACSYQRLLERAL